MAIITNKPTSVSADSTTSLQLNKADLQAKLQALSAGAYWEDQSTWKGVAFLFENASKQKVIASFDASGTTANLNVSPFFVDGSVECKRIDILGFANDHYTIYRENFTSASEFDIEITDGYAGGGAGGGGGSGGGGGTLSLLTGVESFIDVGTMTQINVTSEGLRSGVNIDDNAFQPDALSFPFMFNGTNYQTTAGVAAPVSFTGYHGLTAGKAGFAVGSNGYITFGNSSSIYSSFSTSSPNIPAILLGASDKVINSLYFKEIVVNGVKGIAIRYNASNSASGSPVDCIAQITMFENQKINITYGNWAAEAPNYSGFITGVSGSTKMVDFTPTSNTSFAFSGNASGTVWTVESGKYYG